MASLLSHGGQPHLSGTQGYYEGQAPTHLFKEVQILFLEDALLQLVHSGSRMQWKA